MKKVLAVLLAMFLLVGCSDGAKGDGDKKNDKLKIVGIVNGNLGDKSFFDSVKAGLDELNERDNIETKIIETGYDKTKWEPALLDACDADYDIIVAGTFNMAEHISKAAAQYPKKKFILFDTSVDFKDGKNKNVYTVEYKQNEASYVAGAIAAKMSESGKVGFLGGMDIPVINDFLVGYVTGVQHVNQEGKVAISYIGSFDDAGKGKELGFAQLNNGIDVVFPVASTAGNGALEAVLEKSKDKKVYAIGVDSDQAMLFKEAGDTDKANLIATSVLKNVGKSIVRAVDLELKGELTWGKGERLGFKEGMVGLAKNEIYKKVVPEEIQKYADELEKEIVDGKIEVKTAFGMEKKELNDIREMARP